MSDFDSLLDIASVLDNKIASSDLHLYETVYFIPYDNNAQLIKCQVLDRAYKDQSLMYKVSAYELRIREHNSYPFWVSRKSLLSEKEARKISIIALEIKI